MRYLENQEWWVKMTYQFSPPIQQKQKGFFNPSLTCGFTIKQCGYK